MSQSLDPSTSSISTTDDGDLLRNERKIRNLVAASCDAMLQTLEDGGWSKYEVAMATKTWLRKIGYE